MATVTYKCPNCGGGLIFDPSSGEFKCEYCMSGFTQDQLEEQDEKHEEKQDEKHEEQQETAALLYSCPSCGAEIVTDETTAATFCFYCHNPVVLSGKLEGQYHPDHVLPFAIDREAAVKMFTDWVKKKRYVPKAFFSKDQIEKLTGVYFPYWLYSCEVDGSIDAEGVKLRTWTTGNMQYTETQKFDVRRQGSMDVDHVTRNALKKADKQLVEGVLPFDMNALQPFSMSYLSGFVAEKRDMEKQEFAPQVEEEVKDFAASGLQSSISGYSSVSVRSKETNLKNPRWQYALMPVWTLTYRDKDQDTVYYFACNGQTGKICGKLPVDKGRLAGLFAGIFFPVLAALLIVGYML